LPALPHSWIEGEVKGLRSRGACTIDIKWSQGKVDLVKLKADYDGPVNIRSEWPLSLPLTEGSLENKLLERTEIPVPEVTGFPNFQIDLKEYYEYNVYLKAGESREILPKS